jgi:hypothetical protein
LLETFWEGFEKVMGNGRDKQRHLGVVRSGLVEWARATKDRVEK